MAVCMSWRPVDLDSPDLGEPGVDRKKWGLCFRRVPRGVVRCSDCTDRLSHHPDARVRRMIVSEVGVEPDIVDDLLADPDILVAAAAGIASVANPVNPVALIGSGGTPPAVKKSWRGRNRGTT